MLVTIDAPAGFVPQYALAYGTPDGLAVGVDIHHPLPVSGTRLPAGSAPLAGELDATGIAGPFAPELDRPIWVALSGSWTGQVSVLRSVDGGATKAPLTVAGRPWATFTGNAQEPVGEESASDASYWLSATIRSGTLSYRVSQ